MTKHFDTSNTKSQRRDHTFDNCEIANLINADTYMDTQLKKIYETQLCFALCYNLERLKKQTNEFISKEREFEIDKKILQIVLDSFHLQNNLGDEKLLILYFEVLIDALISKINDNSRCRFDPYQLYLFFER